MNKQIIINLMMPVTTEESSKRDELLTQNKRFFYNLKYKFNKQFEILKKKKHHEEIEEFIEYFEDDFREKIETRNELFYFYLSLAIKNPEKGYGILNRYIDYEKEDENENEEGYIQPPYESDFIKKTYKTYYKDIRDREKEKIMNTTRYCVGNKLCNDVLMCIFTFI